MSALICRKTMRECATPDMCAPFQGCGEPVRTPVQAQGECELTREDVDALASKHGTARTSGMFVFGRAGLYGFVRACFSAQAPQPAAADPAQQDDARELVELLRQIRPNYGAPGSRDCDVTAQRARIDKAIVALTGSAT